MPIGDNKEFAVPNISDGDVTIYFYNASGNTSANDTATAKYMNNNRPIIGFAVRTDQVILITKLAERTLTDPITVPANGSYSESWYENLQHISKINSMTIRTTVDNTNVKIRVKG